MALVLEAALKHAMAAHDVVSVLFAAGAAAPRGHLALAYVLLRAFVFLVLPGLVARDLFLWLARPAGRGRPRPTSSPSSGT